MIIESMLSQLSYDCVVLVSCHLGYELSSNPCLHSRPLTVVLVPPHLVREQSPTPYFQSRLTTALCLTHSIKDVGDRLFLLFTVVSQTITHMFVFLMVGERYFANKCRQ